MSAVAAPRLALSGHDLYLFREGTHSRLYQKLGAHLVEGAIEFALWAPNAASVAVVGDFNGWDPRQHPMTLTRAATARLPPRLVVPDPAVQDSHRAQCGRLAGPLERMPEPAWIEGLPETSGVGTHIGA